jgi:hypothetical protein
MEKSLAEVILKSVLSLGQGLNALDRMVRDVRDTDEQNGCCSVLAL